MNTKLQVLAGILIVGAWFYFDARSDYSWSNIVIKQKTEDGWTLAATQDNFGDLIRPWTLFKTPITGLWFTKPNELRQLWFDCDRPSSSCFL